MTMAPPRPSDMFGVTSPREVAETFELYKSALADSHARTEAGGLMLVPGVGLIESGTSPQAVEALAEIRKTVSPDVMASLEAQFETLGSSLQGDINKDWSSASPLSTGFVAYDLQAPAKLLVPRMTPLVNRTARTTEGVGTTARWKRITGFSNAGVGGVADVSTFFNSETVTNTFGGVTGLRRPNKISYAADEKAIIFQEQGLSDSVTLKAQYQSQGYQNMRQTSQTALLWATKIGEEKGLLYGRGSASGYGGALAAPTGTAAVAVAAAGSQVGNSANIANLFIYVTARQGTYGESVPSTVLNSAALAATTGKVLTISWTDSVGALGYNVYAGTTTGIANAFFVGTTGSNSITMQFTGGGTGGAPNSGAQSTGADSSAQAAAYDGYLTVLSDPAQAGYVGRLNAAFSTTNPGVEYQTAFQAMYAKNFSDPDWIYLYAAGRVALSDLLKTSASANYRLTVDSGETGSGTHLGSIVTGIVNEVTGKMVDIEVHPYMPAGCSLIHSDHLPIPDTEVSSTVEVRNVVDYTAIEWPQVQMTWDISTYMLGAALFYAPAWSGTLLGITNG